MAGTFRSGRHHKPTQLKVLQGAKLREHNRREPKYEAGEPDVPESVSKDPLALEAWRVIAARLLASRVLAKAHGEALALLSHAIADYRRGREQLQLMNHQRLIVDESRAADGSVRKRLRENPLIRQNERTALLMSRLLGEFGLTPVTGPKVAAQREANLDAFQTLISDKPRR